MKPDSALAILLVGMSIRAALGGPFEYPPSLPGAYTEVYRQVENIELKVYIFEQAGAGSNRPAIVFFFGGGWQQGSPGQFEQQCLHFAKRGMVAMAADYRVASRHQAKPVDGVTDAKECLRWVRNNARKLGIDPERIVAAGGSAGRHLAAATATLPGFDAPGNDSGVSSAPNAMILFNPVLMLAPAQGVDLRGYATNFNRERLGAEPEAISPLHHVRRGTPPTVILHGKADTVVPYWSVEAFARAMQKNGNRCDVIGYPGEEHGFFNYGREDNRWFHETLEAADKFLVSLRYLPPANRGTDQPSGP